MKYEVYEHSEASRFDIWCGSALCHRNRGNCIALFWTEKEKGKEDIDSYCYPEVGSGSSELSIHKLTRVPVFPFEVLIDCICRLFPCTHSQYNCCRAGNDIPPGDDTCF